MLLGTFRLAGPIVTDTGAGSAAAGPAVSETDRQRIEAALPARAPAPPRKPRKLLIFDLNVGYPGHGSIRAANLAFTLMGRKTGAFEALFLDALPAALNRLLHDDSPAARVSAVATYHVVVEGVLAETGYRGYARALRDHGLMPGTMRGIELVQRDEARHIAFGLHLLQSWLSADPSLWRVLEEQLNRLLPVALEIISEVFVPFGDDVPFGLQPSEFIAYAGEQLDHRLAALERARRGEQSIPDNLSDRQGLRPPSDI